MNNDFEILALNGETGECLTTADDWLQRVNETPEELGVLPEEVEAIRQKHEAFLTQLEALAVQAIAKGYWDEVYDFISFNAPDESE